MAVTTMHLEAPAEAVYEVLLDAWCYADWVVGAKKIRDVDANWPEPGSRFHHRVGIGPFTLDDSTVLEETAPNHLVLRARARPTGVARVRIDLTPTLDGGTDVEMEEAPISGLAATLHNPVLDGLILVRNRRSLRALADLARARAGSAQ